MKQASIWSNKTKPSNNKYNLFHHPPNLKNVNFPIYVLWVESEDTHPSLFLDFHIQKQRQKDEQKAESLPATTCQEVALVPQHPEKTETTKGINLKQIR